MGGIHWYIASNLI